MNDSIKTNQQIKNRENEYIDCYNNEFSINSSKEFIIDSSGNYQGIKYIKIISIVVKSNENPGRIMRDKIQKVLSCLWTIDIKFNFIIKYDGNKVGIYIGVDCFETFLIPVLRSILESSVPGVSFEMNSEHSDEMKFYIFNNICTDEYNNFGIFGGNPIVRSYNDVEKNLSPIDDIIEGSSAFPWILLISASPLRLKSITDNRYSTLSKITEVSECVEAGYSIPDADGKISMTTNKRFFGSEVYLNHLQSKEQVYVEGMQYGMWAVCTLCLAKNEIATKLFGGLFSSQMMCGEEELKRPFPFRFFYNGKVKIRKEAYQVPKIDNKCITFLTSRELAQMCMFPVRDTSGFNVSERADFDVSRSRKGNLKIGRIVSGNHITQEEYRLELKTLNRHGLIIGLTGGGKTNTVKSILHSIHSLKCPFMIIEPAKKEYFELYRMGITDLQVYSVGSLNGNILKINPFEVVTTDDGKSVSLQSHIDAVFSAFKASFIMYTPMPYVLENAIYAIYRDYGWNVETGENCFGTFEYPTIEDLYYKIESVVQDMGYDSRMQNDLIGSLKARINSLRVGAKGRTLNVAKSIPIEKLLNGNVVIELEDIGDEDAKAFIISLLLMQIQECRKVQETVQLDLRHMLLIEEAHRLLKNISSGSGESADPRGAAVEYFCNMLAELRSKGQGFMVIDQIPSKLAPDLVKNTNLKIIHRTVAKEDRELVGGAMNMTNEQQDYLSCLNQGFAAVYSEGDNRPKHVKLPYAGDYEDNSSLKNLSRDEIIRRSAANCIKQEKNERYTNQNSCNAICRHCRKCEKWNDTEKKIISVLGQVQAHEIIEKIRSMTIEDALIWINSGELRKEINQSINQFEEIKKCFMAYMFQYYVEKMSYTEYARISSGILKIIYKQ